MKSIQSVQYLLRELLLQQFPQTTILSTYVRSSSCEVTQATFNAVLQLRNKMSSMRLKDVQIHDPGQTTSAGYRSWGLEALKIFGHLVIFRITSGCVGEDCVPRAKSTCGWRPMRSCPLSDLPRLFVSIQENLSYWFHNRFKSCGLLFCSLRTKTDWESHL